jgi:hypothetical protein
MARVDGGRGLLFSVFHMIRMGGILKDPSHNPLHPFFEWIAMSAEESDYIYYFI